MCRKLLFSLPGQQKGGAVPARLKLAGASIRKLAARKQQQKQFHCNCGKAGGQPSEVRRSSILESAPLI